MNSSEKPFYSSDPAPDFMNETNPFNLFDQWLQDAEKSEPNDPNAMAIATVDEDGLPNLRMILLKGHDSQGFVFYTNFESKKGGELLANRKSALMFHWKSLRRQIRIRGNVEIVTESEADAYFESRSRGSQLGAWASQQSRQLESRETLEAAVADVEKKYQGQDVPRPPHWSGFRVIPSEIEFWHDRPYRLHDRLLFKRNSIENDWQTMRLNP